MILRMMIIIAILATIKGDEKRDLRKEKLYIPFARHSLLRLRTSLLLKQ